MKISTILDKIDERQLFVPAFQREYVWKRDDAKQLIDSLIKEYPTGTMLTWETANPPELKGPHKYDVKQGAVRILLDGQQRITTLYMLIRGDIPGYYAAQEITNDNRGLYVNVETLELSYYMKTRMENDPRWCNITDIFQRKIRGRDIVGSLEGRGVDVSRDVENLIDDNMRAVENIVTRDFPEQTIPVKANIREAIDIFYKVNASGVSLTEAELALAQISGYWPQARDEFKKKLLELAGQGFIFKLDFIVYALLGCLYNMGSDMRKLHDIDNEKRVREAWNRLEKQILDYVINLMRTHAYVDHTDEINSVYALIPIIVYCFKRQGKHLADDDIRRMIKWFYYSQIRNRYISQLPQKLDYDLRVVATFEQPFDTLLALIAEDRRLEILPDEFVGHSISHPLFGLMRWYMKSRGAICFTTGVGLRKNMGAKYQLEYDHLFPYSRLKKIGYSRSNRIKYSLAQEMTNRIFLTQVANRSKLASPAADYLKEVKKRYPTALMLQCVPEDEILWQMDRYEDFLYARRVKLCEELNAFLDNLTVSAAVTTPATLEDMIAEGESDGLEFKSSLRWDLKQSTVNKKLEDVIVKSIAAFANSDGGMILIGVDNDGKVLGLENDYASLGADRDRFEIHLRNLLNEHLGVVFTKSRAVISFPAISGVEICQIEVSPANEPVILEIKDNQGQKVERFYVRSGNSSVELPISQIKAYFHERFK